MFDFRPDALQANADAGATDHLYMVVGVVVVVVVAAASMMIVIQLEPLINDA